MPLLADRAAAAVTLAGPDLWPPGYEAAAPAERKAWWTHLAREVFEEMVRAMNKGEGADGEKLAPRKRPRRDGGSGPVLVPHWSSSRFQTQLRSGGEEDHGWVRWLSKWGKVVAYHALGLVRGAPVRDVVGLSAGRLAKALGRALRWWAGRERAGVDLGLGRFTLVPGADALVEAADYLVVGGRVVVGSVPPIRPPSWPLPPAPGRPMQPPARGKAPELPRGLPGYEVFARLRPIYEAAGMAATTERSIEATVARLDATQSTAALREAAIFLGVAVPPGDRAAVLGLLRRTLLDRLDEARRLEAGGDAGAGARRGGPKPPPRPRPRPKTKPKPRPPVPTAAAPPPAPEAAPEPATAGPDLAAIRARVADAMAEQARANRAAGERIGGQYRMAQRRRDELLPPGPIAGRVAAYGPGEVKRRAVLEVAGHYRGPIERLEAARGDEATMTRLGTLMREQMLLSRQVMAAGRPTPAQRARLDELDGAIGGIMAERSRLGERLRALKAERDAAIVEVLAAADPIRVAAAPPAAGAEHDGRPVEAPPEGLARAIDEATRWLSRLLARGDGAWGREMVLKVGAQARARAHHANDTGPRAPYHVLLGEESGPDVVVHEFGHAIDARVAAGTASVVDRSKEFLAHRVGAEPPARLNDVVPGGRYGDDEYGRKDRFGAAFGEPSAYYVGKHYPHDATEIVSMGLQLLYNDPAGFAEADPEFFNFILGILDGSLR